MSEGEVTVEQLRADFERLRGEHADAVRGLEEERNGARARVEELEGLQASAAAELASARSRVEELEKAAARVPAGGSGRQDVDLSGLSPGEKIRHGIATRSS